MEARYTTQDVHLMLWDAAHGQIQPGHLFMVMPYRLFVALGEEGRTLFVSKLSAQLQRAVAFLVLDELVYLGNQHDLKIPSARNVQAENRVTASSSQPFNIPHQAQHPFHPVREPPRAEAHELMTSSHIGTHRETQALRSLDPDFGQAHHKMPRHGSIHRGPLDHVAQHDHNQSDVDQFDLETGSKIKRPDNSWLLYVRHMTSLIQQGHPGKKLNAIQIKAILSPQWKAMTEQQRKPWVDQERALAVAFKQKYPNWKRSGGRKRGVETQGADGTCGKKQRVSGSESHGEHGSVVHPNSTGLFDHSRQLPAAPTLLATPMSFCTTRLPGESRHDCSDHESNEHPLKPLALPPRTTPDRPQDFRDSDSPGQTAPELPQDYENLSSPHERLRGAEYTSRTSNPAVDMTASRQPKKTERQWSWQQEGEEDRSAAPSLFNDLFDVMMERQKSSLEEGSEDFEIDKLA
ncbi:hypothetical protein F5Y18DRAFT_428101 [Xylariaceae sp. FL1019]|nr:hypothetical protein F5Y18DRAFT_428101 [Xylariaceae sp. FL1019]